MGNSPHIEKLKLKMKNFYTKLELIVDCTEVAKVMASCDLTIGGAGTTTYERFSLGLPSLLLPMAKHQVQGAELIASTGAAKNLKTFDKASTEYELMNFLNREDLGRVLVRASDAASSICDDVNAMKVQQGHGKAIVSELC